MEPVPHPELDRLTAVSDESQAIGEFVEWLGTQGLVIAFWEEEVLYRTFESTNGLLAQYFDIDLDKVEKERRAILDAIRQ